ncbi:hypothetical protein [Microbacterium testaceum]|uniref:hypothetical protein n=1 Tax=Microbacterium testaceum TaxID=2033 RepID=UPI0022E28E73|nr:hypothetical protein [Microbacterium testaceum]
MNQERPNERAAKQIVERELSIQLEHYDTHGGVDYLSADGTVALEVTAVTDGWKNGARDALRRSERIGAPAVPLQNCWIVSTSLDQTALRTFVQRVSPVIAELEAAGETQYSDQEAAVHILTGGPLSAVYKKLWNAGVEVAGNSSHAVRADDPDHVHQVFVMAGSGGVASTSNDAVSQLMEELRVKVDNPKKLRDSGAGSRHLFVWVNDDTEWSIARPVRGAAASGESDGWRLPDVAPVLDPGITDLWLVHERTLRGWLWNGTTWSAVDASTRDPDSDGVRSFSA